MMTPVVVDLQPGSKVREEGAAKGESINSPN